MILIVTNAEDITTDFVVRELNRNEFVRLNAEQLPDTGALSYEYDGGVFNATVGDGTVLIPLREIRAVYCRRTGTPEPDSSIEDSEVRTYARHEFSALVEALSSLSNVTWINHPHSVRRAESKPLQLMNAQRCGLLVPRTIITNDPARARAFALPLNEVVVKALASSRVVMAGQERIMFTSLVDRSEFELLDSVRLIPCIVQEHIAKVADIRVTVVGKSVFAVEIDSQKDPTAIVDWRIAGADVEHRLHQLPLPLELACIALCETLGLSFGAIDFALTARGEYVFFEINPIGQWAWLELLTAVPIGRAIVDVLRSA